MPQTCPCSAAPCATHSAEDLHAFQRFVQYTIPCTAQFSRHSMGLHTPHRTHSLAIFDAAHAPAVGRSNVHVTSWSHAFWRQSFWFRCSLGSVDTNNSTPLLVRCVATHTDRVCKPAASHCCALGACGTAGTRGIMAEKALRAQWLASSAASHWRAARCLARPVAPAWGAVRSLSAAKHVPSPPAAGTRGVAATGQRIRAFFRDN